MPVAMASFQRSCLSLLNDLFQKQLIGLKYSEEVVCEEPLLTVDRQMGLNIVHPEGKVHWMTASTTVKTHLAIILAGENCF